MKTNDLREVKFYNTIVDITGNVLQDWNIGLRPLESELAFGIIFNSLPDVDTEGKKESVTINPYKREILIFYEGHELVAEILRRAYKSSTDVDFSIVC